MGIIELPVEERLLDLSDVELVEALVEQVREKLKEVDKLYEELEAGQVEPNEFVGLEVDVDLGDETQGGNNDVD